MGNDSFFPKIAMNFVVPIFFETFFSWLGLSKKKPDKKNITGSFRRLFLKGFHLEISGFQDEEYLKELVTTCTKKALQISWLKGISFEMVLFFPTKTW